MAIGASSYGMAIELQQSAECVLHPVLSYCEMRMKGIANERELAAEGSWWLWYTLVQLTSRNVRLQQDDAS